MRRSRKKMTEVLEHTGHYGLLTRVASILQGLGIRSRLIILLLIIIVPTVTIEILVHRQTYETKRGEEFQANIEIARAVARSFEGFIDDVQHQQLALAIALTSTPPLTEKDVRRLLEHSLIDSAAVRDFSWISPQGIVVASSDRLRAGSNRSDEPYFREIISGGDRVVSNLVRSKLMGDSIFVVARAIRDEQGTLLGLVAAEIKPELLDSVLAIQRSTNGSISLMDANGMMIYYYPHVEPSWEGREWTNAQPVVKNVFESGEYAAVVIPPLENKRRMVASTPIGSIGWTAGAGRVEEEVMRPISVGILQETAVLVAVALAFFFVSVALSRSITNPVRRFQRHAISFGRGKMDTRIELYGPPEVRDLARVFNEMAEKIQVLVRSAEQRAADAERSEERFRVMADTIPDIIFTNRTDGSCDYVNKRFYDFTGMNPGEGEGSGWVAVLHPEDSERVIESHIETIRKGEPWESKHRLRTSAGLYRWVIVRARPVFDREGRVSKFLGVATDIDDLIRAQEELHRSREDLRGMRDDLEIRVRARTAELELRNKELQEFTFAASHDLQEPIRKIQTLADLVLIRCRDCLNMENRDYLNRMQNAAARMQGLLNSLLVYSRLTSKVQPFVEVNLAELVKDVFSKLQIQILETKGVMEAGDLPVLNADRGQMAQLFQNLISNALKFHRDDEAPRVRIYSRFVENGKYMSGSYEICVEDNGIGFEEKYLNLIFMPFECLHGREKYKGLGMGLAICKKIVELHGGTITARSTPGKGSTFIVTLPAKQGKTLSYFPPEKCDQESQ
jgi:PAS domain S-box-containing protein